MTSPSPASPAAPSVGLRALRAALAVVPAAPKFNPVADAIAKATALNEAGIASTLQSFASMPASTGILANPPLYETPVVCGGKEVRLKVRGFAIRGMVHESDIVRRSASAWDVVFAGLFARKPAAGESGFLRAIVDRAFGRAFGDGTQTLGAAGVTLEELAAFVLASPKGGPEVAIQYAACHRKARLLAHGRTIPAINDDRRAGHLLLDFFQVHAANIAVGVAAILLSRASGSPAAAATDLSNRLFGRAARKGRSALGSVYDALLGRPTPPALADVLEGMGAIQIHHGSAGSNMVARYLTTLHVPAVADFFVGAHIALDCDRHFGAIHDMTRFLERIERLPAAEVDAAIRAAVLHGGLPTFGHPEISAAGRGKTVEQDPRPAIYLAPLLAAIDTGTVALDPHRRARLRLLQRIYQVAFVEGVVKPGRETEDPLRLTPNTDFGAWGVQEALGVAEVHRTFLTYCFRGFGWVMDAREQLQQKIIRPVIPPEPTIVPKPDGDDTIPAMIRAVHDRLAASAEAFAKR